MPDDVCTGAAGAAERGLEFSAEHDHALLSGYDVLNMLAGRGVSTREGDANIKAFNECNKERTEEHPTLPRLRFN